jgi:transposase
MLEMVYGESAMKRKTVYKWVDRFKEGTESVDDDARAGRSSTSHVDENIQRVYDLVKADSRITFRMIAEKLGVSNGSVQTILKEDLNMRKHAKIVPKVLTGDQKQGRVDCCNDWIESAQDPHFREKK